MKHHIPSNITEHDKILPKQHLESRKYLQKLDEWSKSRKIQLNIEKTKGMIFNFSSDQKITIKFEVENKSIGVVEDTRLLGLILSSGLKWDKTSTIS